MNLKNGGIRGILIFCWSESNQENKQALDFKIFGMQAFGFKIFGMRALQVLKCYEG